MLVSNVDSQASIEGAILIQVLGEISNDGQESRKFGQTFCLAPQESGYYVYNDIFRFLKEDVESEFGDDGHYEAEPRKEANGVKDASYDAAASTPQPSTVPTTHQNGQSETVAEIEKAAEAPVHAPDLNEEVVQSATQTPAAAPTEQPQPSPQKSDAVEAIAEPVSKPDPPKPAAQLSWAARAAVNAPKPVAAPQVTKPAPAAPKPTTTTEQTPRPTSTSASGIDTSRSAFLKNVTPKMQDDAIRTALSKFGTVKQIDLNRPKQCGFVDYLDHQSCTNAIKANKVLIGGTEQLLVEERRKDPRKPSSKKKSNNNNNNNSKQKKDLL